MAAAKGKKASASRAEASGQKAASFSAEERAAMRERARELKEAPGGADGEAIVLAKIAEMAEPDREMATRLCAGCPVRAECLEFELRVAGEKTVGVWGGLNVDDRLALLKVWRARRRDEIAALPDDEGWWRP